jgi:hypothetical protein
VVRWEIGVEGEMVWGGLGSGKGWNRGRFVVLSVAENRLSFNLIRDKLAERPALPDSAGAYVTGVEGCVGLGG